MRRFFVFAVAVIGCAAIGASASGPRTPVAVVGEREITWGEVDAASNGKISALRREVLATKKAALRALIEDRLMEAAAKAAGLSRRAFYEREVRGKAEAVREVEVEEFYRKHRRDLTGDPAADKAAVRFYLERKARKKRERVLLAELARRFGVERQLLSDEEWLGDRGAVEVARVGDSAITDSMVEERAKLKLYRLRGELAREALRQANVLIEKALLALAAREEGVSVEELQSRIGKRAAQVTDADVDRYFREKMLAENPAAEKHPERIRTYLEFLAKQEARDAFVAQMRERGGVRVLVAEPEPVRLSVPPASWAPTKGPGKADVKLTVFYNYHCRYCVEMLRVYGTLAEEFSAKVSISLRHFIPLYDPVADDLARGAVCAAKQGKFWEYHERVVMAPQDAIRASAVAEKLGLAGRGFSECLLSADTSSVVERDTEAARVLGLEEAPAILVNSRVFGGKQGLDRLEAVLREELSSAR